VHRGRHRNCQAAPARSPFGIERATPGGSFDAHHFRAQDFAGQRRNRYLGSLAGFDDVDVSLEEP
jgi:hypothetical protein